MKKSLELACLMIIALALTGAADAQKFSFHGESGDPKRFFDPKSESYSLPGGIKIAMKMEAAKEHSTSQSELEIFAQCPGNNKPKAIAKLQVCGFTHFTYSKTSEITLHLTEYDPGSVEGLCTGESYTKVVKVCGK